MKEDAVNDAVDDSSTVTTWSNTCTIRSDDRHILPRNHSLESIDNNRIQEYRPPSYSHSDSFTFISLMSRASDIGRLAIEEKDDPVSSFSDRPPSETRSDDEVSIYDKYAIADRDNDEDDDDENDFSGVDKFWSVASFTRDMACYGDLCEPIRSPSLFKNRKLHYIEDSSRSIIPMGGADLWDDNQNLEKCDDEDVPVGVPGASSYINLVNGRGENLFLGMLIECVEDTTIPGFSEAALTAYPNGRKDCIMSTTSIVLRDTLGVNMSVETRTARLTKALESRKGKSPILDKDLEDSHSSDTGPVTPTNDAVLFNVTTKTRQSRLSKALHRGRGNNDKEFSTNNDDDIRSSNDRMASRANVMKHRIARVTKILRSRRYVSEEERARNEGQLALFRLALTMFLFRFMSKTHKHLTYLYGPLVAFDTSAKTSFNLLMDVVWLLMQYFNRDRIQDNDSVEISELEIEDTSTDLDSGLVELEKVWEIDEFPAYIPPPFVQEFVKEVDELTDLTADYINAHSSIPINDKISDDDGMEEELFNLKWIEEELRRDILAARLDIDELFSSEQLYKVRPETNLAVDSDRAESGTATHSLYQNVFAIKSNTNNDDDDRSSTETESTFDVQETRRAVLETVERIQAQLPPTHHLTESLPMMQRKLMNDLMLLSGASTKQSSTSNPSEENCYSIVVGPETALSSMTFGASYVSIDSDDNFVASLKEGVSMQELGIEHEYPSLVMNLSSASGDLFEGSIIMGLIPSLIDDSSDDYSTASITKESTHDDCLDWAPQSDSEWGFHNQYFFDDPRVIHVRKAERKTVLNTLLEGHPKREFEKNIREKCRIYPSTLQSSTLTAFQHFDSPDQVLWRTRVQDEKHMYPVVEPERKQAIESAFQRSLDISRGERIRFLVNENPDEIIYKTEERVNMDHFRANGGTGDDSVPKADGTCTGSSSEVKIERVSRDFVQHEFERVEVWHDMEYVDTNYRDPPVRNFRADPSYIHESDLEPPSKIPSFQGNRSMKSSMTELVPQIQGETHLSLNQEPGTPVWSLSPVINTFSTESDKISDSNWSLSPELTPRETRALLEMYGSGHEWNSASDIDKTEAKQPSTSSSTHQTVLRCVSNRPENFNPKSCHDEPEQGANKHQTSGLAMFSDYWTNLLNGLPGSRTDKDCRDDYAEHASSNRSVSASGDARFVGYNLATKNDEEMQAGYPDSLRVDPSGCYSRGDYSLKGFNDDYVQEDGMDAIYSVPRYTAQRSSSFVIARNPSLGDDPPSRPEGGDDDYDPFEAAAKIPEAFSDSMLEIDSVSHHGLATIDDPEGAGIEAFLLPTSRTMLDWTRTRALSDISDSTDGSYSHNESTQWSVSLGSSSSGLMETSENLTMSVSIHILATNDRDQETPEDQNRPPPCRFHVATSSKPKSDLFDTIGDFLFSWTLRGLDKETERRNDIRTTEERLRGIKHY